MPPSDPSYGSETSAVDTTPVTITFLDNMTKLSSSPAQNEVGVPTDQALTVTVDFNEDVTINPEQNQFLDEAGTVTNPGFILVKQDFNGGSQQYITAAAVTTQSGNLVLTIPVEELGINYEYLFYIYPGALLGTGGVPNSRDFNVVFRTEGTTVTGRVTIPGMPVARNTAVKFIDISTGEEYLSTVLDGRNTFTFTNVQAPSGKLALTIELPGYIPYQIKPEYGFKFGHDALYDYSADMDSWFASVPMVGGNAYGADNKINIRDAAIIAAAINTGSGDARWDARADINADGIVNSQDLTLMGSNFWFEIADPYLTIMPSGQY